MAAGGIRVAIAIRFQLFTTITVHTSRTYSLASTCRLASLQT